MEDREAGGGPAHVDDGDAQRALVLREHGAGSRIGCHHETGHAEMRALDGECQILEMRRLDGDDAEIEARRFAEHAERFLHTLRIVEMILDGSEMQDVAAAGIDLRQGGVQHPVEIVRAYLPRLRFPARRKSRDCGRPPDTFT
jgi:hypothetical protein